MNVNAYDIIERLEQDVKKLPEFLAIKKAYETVKENQASYELFRSYQRLHIELQEKYFSGEEITDADRELLEDLSTKVEEHDSVKVLMKKEQDLSNIISGLNQAIVKPIQELYKN